jgi:hypothetical protein
MTYASKHATVAAVVWFIILVGLTLAVVVPGVSRFADPDYSMLRLATAVIILPGFILNAWLGYKSRLGQGRGLVDERDEAIGPRAAEITLYVLAIVVFLSSLLLYETSAETGLVSRGWMYLMAYGSIALLCFVHAISSLILDRRGWSDA